MPVGIVGSAHVAANPARCCGGPGLAADKRSGVNPFVIALAMVNQGTVVTEENATGNIAKPRIPDVCDALGVPCLTLIGYIEAQVDILSLQGSRHDGPTPNPRCAKSVPRQATTAHHTVDGVDTNRPPSWTYRDASDTARYGVDGPARIYTPAVGGSIPSAPTSVSQIVAIDRRATDPPLATSESTADQTPH